MQRCGFESQFDLVVWETRAPYVRREGAYIYIHVYDECVRRGHVEVMHPSTPWMLPCTIQQERRPPPKTTPLHFTHRFAASGKQVCSCSCFNMVAGQLVERLGKTLALPTQPTSLGGPTTKRATTSAERTAQVQDSTATVLRRAQHV